MAVEFRCKTRFSSCCLRIYFWCYKNWGEIGMKLFIFHRNASHFTFIMKSMENWYQMLFAAIFSTELHTQMHTFTQNSALIEREEERHARSDVHVKCRRFSIYVIAIVCTQPQNWTWIVCYLFAPFFLIFHVVWIRKCWSVSKSIKAVCVYSAHKLCE